jgi:tryptophan synthase alpha chain
MGLPVAVGFGVKTPDDARSVAQHAAGVVVGSAICSVIESAPDADAAVQRVTDLVASLKRACQR